MGAVLEDGGLPITSVGFLLSHSPDFNESERIEVEFTDDSNQTFVLSDTTADDEIIYIRAFATNSLGESLGQIIKISPPEKDIISSLSWFGEFLSYENQWIFHTRLGWLYMPTPDSENGGVWVWSPTHNGWLWTDQNTFPHIYQDSNGNWIYLVPAGDHGKTLYDYETESFQ